MDLSVQLQTFLGAPPEIEGEPAEPEAAGGAAADDDEESPLLLLLLLQALLSVSDALDDDDTYRGLDDVLVLLLEVVDASFVWAGMLVAISPSQLGHTDCPSLFPALLFWAAMTSFCSANIRKRSSAKKKSDDAIGRRTGT